MKKAINAVKILGNSVIFGLLVILSLVYFGMGLFYGMQVVLMCSVPAITFVFVFEVIEALKNKSNAQSDKSEVSIVEIQAELEGFTKHEISVKPEVKAKSTVKALPKRSNNKARTPNTSNKNRIS